MARRSKIPPTTRQLRFQLEEGAFIHVIDIAQCLSLLNRKFFRQGQEYYVDSWHFECPGIATCRVSYLSQNWVTTNAWVKAFRTWMKSQEQLEDFDEIKGRYHDFKVFLDESHALAGMPVNLKPSTVDFGKAAVIDPTISANWEASHIQIPNDGVVGVTNEYDLHMVGPDGAGVSSKGIVAGYANSRSRPVQDDPNLVFTPSWMDFAFDDGDNLIDIRSDVVTENDSPPYLITEDGTHEFYPGGSNGAQAGALAAAGAAMSTSQLLNLNPASGAWASKSAPGFVVPCGLLLVSGAVDTADAFLTVNIAPGPAKGVMARPMQDVN